MENTSPCHYHHWPHRRVWRHWGAWTETWWPPPGAASSGPPVLVLLRGSSEPLPLSSPLTSSIPSPHHQTPHCQVSHQSWGIWQTHYLCKKICHVAKLTQCLSSVWPWFSHLSAGNTARLLDWRVYSRAPHSHWKQHLPCERVTTLTVYIHEVQ